MKLLVITQKVDKEDSVLGFFHNWILKLSDRFEGITVICLEKGRNLLPNSIKVLSLGKESGENKIKYIKNFYKYIYQERRNYDSVFVHMNQEYVLLGSLFWKILGKKIYLWRNHPSGNLFTKVAIFLSDKVFCTSKDSFTARSEKTVIMPVGIDNELFKPQTADRKKDSILFLGRIAPVKNVSLFVQALKILKEKQINFEASIYGDALPKDREYFNNIKNTIEESNLSLEIKLYPGVPNYEAPSIYSKHEIYVNLTPSGSFDKTILEAAACDSLSLVSNRSLLGFFPDKLIINKNSPGNIAESLEYWLKSTDQEREEVRNKIRRYVLESHSLNALIEKLSREIF